MIVLQALVNGIVSGALLAVPAIGFTAMFAVQNMQGASHDLWEVNTDFEYHEEQKIEDPTPAPVVAGS